MIAAEDIHCVEKCNQALFIRRGGRRGVVSGAFQKLIVPRQDNGLWAQVSTQETWDIASFTL